MKQYQEMSAFYENEGQEQNRLSRDNIQYIEFLTASRYLDKVLPAKASILDSCAGTGIYAFNLAQKGHLVTAGDIVPFNVAFMEAEQGKSPLSEIYLGDATDLSRFADESFDAVLCMGALYHLLTVEEREKAIAESMRVLKKGGLLAATYMNRYAVIMNNLEQNLDNIDEILDFSEKGIEGIFYASTPLEMEQLMTQFSLEKLYHVALDGMAIFLTHTANVLSPEALERWRQYHFAVCEEQSLLGSSYHNMYIGRK